jgi:thiosulfate/3-mercaptopyruvate sulfurtransferase
MLCQDSKDPWSKSEFVDPDVIAKSLTTSEKPAKIICVAFPVLYNARHLPNAVFAGPGSKPEGIEMLKKAVAGVPKDADILLYCGCCPMVKCPNMRPAFTTLKQMGYTHVRALNIPTNMHTDWYSKNYPTEEGKGGN